MAKKREEEPEFRDKDVLPDKLNEDWTSTKPYENVEREILHSTINKTTQVIKGNVDMKNQEQKATKVKVNDEIKVKNSPYNMDRFKRLMSEEDGKTRRSYTLRNITIRKMGELKVLHPDINISLNMLIDMALNHYYEYIKGGGEFEDY